MGKVEMKTLYVNIPFKTVASSGSGSSSVWEQTGKLTLAEGD